MASHNTPADVDFIDVQVGTIGGTVKTVRLNGDRTVRALLIAAGFPEDCEVKINGETYKGDDTVEAGDNATVLQGERVKGGSR